MLNVPNLPTDNLYKFVALLGLVIVASSWAAPYFLNDSLHTEYTSRLDRVNDKVREMQLKLEMDPKTQKAANQKEAERVAGFVWSEGHNLDKWFEQRQQIFEDQVKACNWLWWSGLFLAVAGLALWYRLVQRRQDSLLLLQIKQAEMAIASAEASTAKK